MNLHVTQEEDLSLKKTPTLTHTVLTPHTLWRPFLSLNSICLLKHKTMLCCATGHSTILQRGVGEKRYHHIKPTQLTTSSNQVLIKLLAHDLKGSDQNTIFLSCILHTIFVPEKKNTSYYFHSPKPKLEEQPCYMTQLVEPPITQALQN
jgi:hypothetical protein